MKREIIQIAFEVSGLESSSQLHALADDGTIWCYNVPSSQWLLWELPELPQSEIKDSEV